MGIALNLYITYDNSLQKVVSTELRTAMKRITYKTTITALGRLPASNIKQPLDNSKLFR